MKTSIIILTYNNFLYSKKCIESIRKYTKRSAYEIIVVDNNSKDETKNWLSRQKDIKKIYNSTNLGFPKGCNLGIKAASGSEMLFLNNDVVVAENWLSNLKKCLYSNSEIGAVGPVTNRCSGIQQINVKYNSLVEMHEFSKKYNISNSRKWIKTDKLVGFCILIKRVVMEKVGLFDERFTPGNFEDDDYCLRIRKKGYRLFICRDTFIHHYGCVSFGNYGYGKLIRTNKIKFEKKWGKRM
ncbi:glycosyltransferase family 2 protein [Clostridium felsineum]|uniref:glycosyltransferase family 2 protein n=1 Tax=Clostridium felsineum TaxID=36839 RepID=UPI00098CDC27|nr:glycosyltransferase family 2 protein [Clostridium felsineum]MCR3759843.1 glycosyltransferase family 2 protein [Clostridium felsineum]URZ00127.1 hypothetical protein CLAUR_001150 [Clostridium felsineum]